jgi:hypothetical protein
VKPERKMLRKRKFFDKLEEAGNRLFFARFGQK